MSIQIFGDGSVYPHDPADDTRSTGGVAIAQTDWNAKEGEPGHIKNKPEFEWIATSVEQQFEVFPETQVGNHTDAGAASIKPEDCPVLVDGQKYIVYYDGTPYECTAKEYQGEENGYTFISMVLGNTAVAKKTGSVVLPEYVEEIDTGEPFLIITAYVVGHGFYDGTLCRDDEPLGKTVSIKIDGFTSEPVKMPGKFLPEGVPYQEVILPPTDFAYYEPMDAFVHTKKINLVAGKAYTVIYNGVSYECVCKTAELNGIPLLALGNLVATGGENTGEPFSLGLYGDEVAAQFGGIYLGAFALDGAQSVEFAIYGPDMRKLDNRLLDLDWLPTKRKGAALFGPNACALGFMEEIGAHVYTITEFFDIKPGNEYVVVWDGKEFLCTAWQDDYNYLIGNHKIFGGQDSGEPFVIVANTSDDEIYAESIVDLDAGDAQTVERTVAIYPVAYNSLPEPFLPESVDGVVIRSSTEGSTKKFKLTIDDSGTISATEVTE